MTYIFPGGRPTVVRGLALSSFFLPLLKPHYQGRVVGFVVGGRNIAVAAALPPSFVYCIANIKWFMDFLYLIFYACLRLRFLDVETNPGPRLPFPAVCRILCSNVPGLAGNLSDLAVASSLYDILLCSETLVSDVRHVSELLVPECIKQTFDLQRLGRVGQTGGPAHSIGGPAHSIGGPTHSIGGPANSDGVAICRSSNA